MAHAPHTNTDYSYNKDVTLLLGQFAEEDHVNFFEYAARPSDLDTHFAPDAQHIVYVGFNGDFRFARVLKTVAYIAIDEDADGFPVWEKWSLKQHHQYLTQWAIDDRAETQRRQAA